jgi:hypothetical protein
MSLEADFDNTQQGLNGGSCNATAQDECCGSAPPTADWYKDFWAHLQCARFNFAPTGDIWSAGAINQRFPYFKKPGNCLFAVITTNHKESFYLPPDDRRHYVAWSDATLKDFKEGYFEELWKWANDGGDRHVAAYLKKLDISSFNTKAPPTKTPVFWEIVTTNQAPEDSELADATDHLGEKDKHGNVVKTPDALTLANISFAAQAKGDQSFAEWLVDRKNRRAIPHRLERIGYVSVRNEGANDGLWKVQDKRQTIYAKNSLTFHKRYEAAERLAGVAVKQNKVC